MERFIESFEARDDTGKTHQIHLYQEMIDVTPSLSQQRDFIPGLKRYATSDGEALNFINDNTFKFVSPEKTIIRIS